MSLLLHACCGPCLAGSAPPLVTAFGSEEVILFWENPNIHPYLEYRERLLSFQRAATQFGLPVLYGDAEYGLDRFLHALGPRTGPERCAVCHRLRLEAAAKRAARESISAITTTLLISPYQDHDLLQRIGKEVAALYRIGFVATDLRPHFRTTFAESRRLGLYRQSYCGCIFSEQERYRASKKHQLPLPDRLDGHLGSLPDQHPTPLARS